MSSGQNARVHGPQASTAQVLATKPYVGRNLPRREAYRFVQGDGEYGADIKLADALHLCIVRSPYAHARITKIDVTKALEIPGVRGAFTGGDLQASGMKVGRPTSPQGPENPYPLAVSKVRYFGEPVVAVVADSKYTAEDGAMAVEVEYETLEPNLDPYKVMEGKDASLIHENMKSNLAFDKTWNWGDVDGAFAKAQKIVKRNRLHVHRFIANPLEPTVIQADYNSRSNEFYIIIGLKGVEVYRAGIAGALGVPPTSIHFRAPDIGGSFGIKDQTEWTILCAWISRRLKRPIKYVSTQSEMITATHHSEEIWWDAELAVNLDGTILGFRARCIHDGGAYASLRGIANQLRNPAEMYRFKAFQLDVKYALTNKVWGGANRGYAKLHHVFMLERMIDAAAQELKLDPMKMRLQNLVRQSEMPYITPNGAVYDGGDYQGIVNEGAKLFDYEGFRREQQEMLKQGRYFGCGVGTGINSNPSSESKEFNINPNYDRSGNSDAASVKIDQYGKVLVCAGDVPQGQGHETSNAQIVADALGMPYDDVVVTRGYDSWRDPSTPFSLTASDRWAVMGTGALLGASKLVKDKVLRIASHLLGSTNLEMEQGKVTDKSTGKTITVAEVARLAYLDLEKLPKGMEPGLEARFVYQAKYDNAGGRAIPGKDSIANLAMSYTYEATFVGVEVDMKTFEVKVKKVAHLHDCGRQINPGIVEGLSHGAMANHVGAALFEKLTYDENGQLLTTTFKDYTCPTAYDLPNYTIGEFVVPSLFTPLGVRATAEGAGSATAATIAAVEDALASFGVKITESNVSPSDIREMVLARLEKSARAG